MVNFGKMNRLLGYKKFKDEIEKDDKIQNNIVEKGYERNIKKMFHKVCTVCLIKKIFLFFIISFAHIFISLLPGLLSYRHIWGERIVYS